MIRRRKILILFILFAVFRVTPSHSRDKFHFHIDYNYLWGLHEKNNLENIESGLNGFDLNISGMYNINKRLSTGIGIGVEKLYNPMYTIFPIYAKIVYNPFLSTERPYIYSKLGYGIGTEVSNAGLLFNTGVGYKHMFRKHFGINFMVGYHLQGIRYEAIDYSENGVFSTKKANNNYRHSLSFGTGFIF